MTKDELKNYIKNNNKGINVDDKTTKDDWENATETEEEYIVPNSCEIKFLSYEEKISSNGIWWTYIHVVKYEDILLRIIYSDGC